MRHASTVQAGMAITARYVLHAFFGRFVLLSSGMAITVRCILHFFFAASFFTFGNIMRTKGEKAEGAFDSLNQAAFAAALTATLSAFAEELKSLWLALCADAVWLLSSIAIASNRPTDKDMVYVILISQFPFIITRVTVCFYEFITMFSRPLVLLCHPLLVVICHL